MARLIDADALLMSCCSAFDEECFDPKHGYCPLEIEGKYICNAPTIDAIPVEWLREKMLRPQMTEGNPFGFVLAEWLEEQEAR